MRHCFVREPQTFTTMENLQFRARATGLCEGSAPCCSHPPMAAKGAWLVGVLPKHITIKSYNVFPSSFLQARGFHRREYAEVVCLHPAQLICTNGHICTDYGCFCVIGFRCTRPAEHPRGDVFALLLSQCTKCGRRMYGPTTLANDILLVKCECPQAKDVSIHLTFVVPRKAFQSEITGPMSSL